MNQQDNIIVMMVYERKTLSNNLIVNNKSFKE